MGKVLLMLVAKDTDPGPTLGGETVKLFSQNNISKQFLLLTFFLTISQNIG